MNRVVATILALLFLNGEAYAYCRFAEQHFGKHRQFGQHIDDEAFGDEFKCYREGLQCCWKC